MEVDPVLVIEGVFDAVIECDDVLLPELEILGEVDTVAVPLVEGLVEDDELAEQLLDAVILVLALIDPKDVIEDVAVEDGDVEADILALGEIV